MEEERSFTDDDDFTEPTEVVSFKDYFIDFFVRIFNITDPLINIWMLSRYSWFSNLTLTYSIFTVLSFFIFFITNRRFTDVEVIVGVFHLMYLKISLIIFLINFYLNAVEMMYFILKIFIYDFFHLKKDLFEYFLDCNSLLISLFILISFIISTFIVYRIETKYFKSFTLENKNVIISFNNISFVLVLIAFTIYSYSYFLFFYNFLFNKIIYISIYTFLSTILVRIIVTKYANNLYYKLSLLIL